MKKNMKKNNVNSIREIFWSRVDLFFGITDEDCWNWTGGGAISGHGRMSIGGKKLIATHVAWLLRYGVEPTRWMLHKCDNPYCVNPSHLFEGDRNDNARDCVNKGRHFWKRRTHCTRGHTYNNDNTITKSNGRRICRVCAEIRWANWRARKNPTVEIEPVRYQPKCENKYHSWKLDDTCHSCGAAKIQGAQRAAEWRLRRETKSGQGFSPSALPERNGR